ncbi:MAG: hypothetical protein Kow0069_32280 [Promethearchaeota archaeon]
MATKVPKGPRRRDGDEEEFLTAKMLRFAGWGFVVVLGVMALAWFPFDLDVNRYTINIALFCTIGASFSFGVASAVKAKKEDEAYVKHQFRTWLLGTFLLALVVIFTFSAYMFGEGPLNHP